MPALADLRDQAVTGVSPPQTNEAIIRDVWQSLAAHAGPAGLARACYSSLILAPVGWLILAPFFMLRFLAPMPGMSGFVTRYRLTNRRLMVCKGYKAVPDKEVPLDTIKDVKLVSDATGDYFFSGTLEIIDATGRTVLTMPGVREPESMRHSIMQAVDAWGPVLKAEKKS